MKCLHLYTYAVHGLKESEKHKVNPLLNKDEKQNKYLFSQFVYTFKS